MRTAARVLAIGLVVVLLGTSCATWRVSTRPLRVSEVRDDGDATRRASLSLILEGLDWDAQGSRRRARASYERALQVDATNPYAYLALARHEVDGTRPERALPFLDRAEVLLRTQGDLSPGVEVHLDGLRGDAMYRSGRVDEGIVLLERARKAAPSVWSDGHLSPEELR